MNNIIKNVCKILLKRKGFIFATFVLPIIVVFLFSSLNSTGSSVNIAISNKDKGELGKVIEEKLGDIDSINLSTVKDDKVEDLIFHKYEILIKIDKDFTENLKKGNLDTIKIKSLQQSSEVESIITSVINSECKSLAKIFNNVNIDENNMEQVIDEYKDSKPDYKVISGDKGKGNIEDSLGIVMYIICISSACSVVFLVEDDKGGTKERILMSKIGEKTYYAAMCTVFFIFSIVPALEYYVIANLLDLEFGFEHKYYLLILLLLIVLVSVIFSIFLSSIIKKKNIFTLLNSTITLPMFMIGGCFWPYELMSKSLQNIATVLPPRWIMASIEELQKGCGFIEILPQIGGMVVVIIILFLLSLFCTRNKLILIKDK